MLGTLISAGSSLLSGLLGSRATKEANKDNAALQKEAAQNQVQWRVADANKAGVSPLAALGMTPISMSPSYVGNDSMASAVGNMGQDIGRAVTAKMGPQERVTAAMNAIQLENGQLQNDLLRTQIRRLNSPGTPPGIAADTIVPGQGDVPVVELTNPTRTAGVTNRRGEIMPTSPMMDAQVAENRYGDSIQEAFGFRAFMQDYFPEAMEYFDRRVTPPSYGGRDVTGGMPY